MSRTDVTAHGADATSHGVVRRGPAALHALARSARVALTAATGRLRPRHPQARPDTERPPVPPAGPDPDAPKPAVSSARSTLGGSILSRRVIEPVSEAQPDRPVIQEVVRSEGSSSAGRAGRGVQALLMRGAVPSLVRGSRDAERGGRPATESPRPWAGRLAAVGRLSRRLVDAASTSAQDVAQALDRRRGGLLLVVPVVLALLSAGLIGAVVVKTQQDGTGAPSASAGHPGPTTAPGAPVDDGPTIVVIGDEAVDPSVRGEGAGRGWAALVAKALHARVIPLRTDGAGYVTPGSGSRTFGDRLVEVPPGADAVVFVGGAADAGASPIAVAKAATAAFAAAHRRAGAAAVLAVGPLRTGSRDVAAVASVRSTLRAATGIAEVPWVDPVAGRWLRGTSEGTGALSDGDEQVVASRIGAVLRGRID